MFLILSTSWEDIEVEKGHEVGYGNKMTERFFGMAGAEVSSYCGDKEKFIGCYHGYGNPDGVVNGKLDGALNYNVNGCGALATVITIEPGETKNVAFVLGMKGDAEAESILKRYAAPGETCEKELEKLIS